MQINEIKSMWNMDAKIDKNNLEVETLTIDTLHAKYAMLLYDIAVEKSNISKELDALRIQKFNYYSGNGDKVSPVKIMKSLVSNYVDTDKDILDMQHVLSECVARYTYVDSIIWAISRRNSSIQNYISVLKLQKGI